MATSADTKRKKTPWEKIALPEGTLRYPWLNKPDTGRQYSDGKYKTEIVYEEDQRAAVEAAVGKILAQVQKATIEATGRKKVNIENPIKEEIDKDTEEPTGRIYLKIDGDDSSKERANPPKLFQPHPEKKGVVVPCKESVFSGSRAILRIAYNTEAYLAQGKFFWQRRIDEVLITELVTKNGGYDPNSSSFGSVERDRDNEGDEDNSSEGNDTDGDSTDF